eukprot:14743431-Alexandrium_andersonii.AAC.1
MWVWGRGPNSSQGRSGPHFGHAAMNIEAHPKWWKWELNTRLQRPGPGHVAGGPCLTDMS